MSTPARCSADTRGALATDLRKGYPPPQKPPAEVFNTPAGLTINQPAEGLRQRLHQKHSTLISPGHQRRVINCKSRDTALAPWLPAGDHPDVIHLTAYRAPAPDDGSERAAEIERLRKQIDHSMSHILSHSKFAWQTFDRLSGLGTKL